MARSLSELSALDLRALMGLFDAYRAAADAFGLESNTPRSEGAASDILQEEEEKHHLAAETVVREIEGRRINDPSDAERRAAFLIAWHARAEDWSAVIRLVGEGLTASEAAYAAARARHGRP